ncbi:MAG: exonuclease domain-containing protein [Candidatus Omnitrophica bacterium]|nr:exonuclease domain-containing protein [Candidatus Omnitrophota bacterium]
MNNREISEVEFTIFDTETTGLSPRQGDHIIEIAAQRFQGDSPIKEFSSLINPGAGIINKAVSINHISQDMLVDAPSCKEVIPAFIDFVRDSCLCAYNLPFDIMFLEAELESIGGIFPSNIALIDILTMARKLLPQLPSYSLANVAAYLGIKEEQKHRAMSDVVLTRKIFNIFWKMLTEKGINQFNQLVSLFSLPRNLLNDLVAQKIAEIQEAIDQNRVITIQYFSRTKADVSIREVVPKKIEQNERGFFMVGFCKLRGQERIFRIDHILDIQSR